MITYLTTALSLFAGYIKSSKKRKKFGGFYQSFVLAKCQKKNKTSKNIFSLILFAFSKINLKIITGLSTGPLYQKDEETSEHVLYHCPTVTNRKLKRLRKPFIETKQMNICILDLLLRFIKTLNIIQDN